MGEKKNSMANFKPGGSPHAFFIKELNVSVSAETSKSTNSLWDPTNTNTNCGLYAVMPVTRYLVTRYSNLTAYFSNK